LEKEENLVKKTCKELGITQKELGEKIGITEKTISGWAK
jgi:DNA-binding XRE family transcriptional regulator